MQAHFQYWHNSDVSMPLKLKLDELHFSWLGVGQKSVRSFDVSVALVLDGKKFGPSIPVGRVNVSKDAHSVNRFITLPISIKDLPLDSWIVIECESVDDVKDVLVATLPLFNERTLLRQSRQLLILLPPYQVNYSAESLTHLRQSTVVALEDDRLHQLPLALRLDKQLDLYARRIIPESYPCLDETAVDTAQQVVDISVSYASQNLGVSFVSLHLPILAHPVLYGEAAYPTVQTSGPLSNFRLPSGVSISNSLEKGAVAAGTQRRRHVSLVHDSQFAVSLLKSGGVPESSPLYRLVADGGLSVWDQIPSSETGISPDELMNLRKKTEDSISQLSASSANSAAFKAGSNFLQGWRQVARQMHATPGDTSASAATSSSSTIMRPRVFIHDGNVGKEHPVSVKHELLMRAQHNASTKEGLKASRSLRPAQNEMTELARIIDDLPVGKSLSQKDKNLLWRFRGFLMSNGAALPSFLLAVDFSNQVEAEEAMELLQLWHRPSTADALRLLSADFDSLIFRRYAVSCMAKASDDELMVYILQLVQSIRYEKSASDRASAEDSQDAPREEATDEGEQTPGHSVAATSGLVELLVSRSCRNEKLASMLHWYLLSEAVGAPLSDEQIAQGITQSAETVDVQSMFARALRQLDCQLGKSIEGHVIRVRLRQQRVFRAKLISIFNEMRAHKGAERKKLAMRELMSDPSVFTSLYASMGNLHPTVATILAPLFEDEEDAANDAPKGAASPTAAGEEGAFTRSTQATTNKRPGKYVDVVSGLSNSALPFPYPIDPSYGMVKVIPSKCTVFRSAMFPVLVCAVVKKLKSAELYAMELEAAAKEGRLHAVSQYESNEEQEVRFIFKCGDDLRQDQLIMQLFRWGNGVLQARGLDLKLSPYFVLGFTLNDGVVEFVDKSKAIADVLKEFGDIKSFFRKSNPKLADSDNPPRDADGIPSEVNDAYLRSCSGYCVLTYLLGIGDRHLDNLMLTTDGKLCHIDFGFIFGHDPKPWPPPMRLNRQMVDGLDGVKSERFQTFRRLCAEAFRYIRRESKLLLSMIHLMFHSGIEDMGDKPEIALEMVRNKFRLDLDENASEHYLQKNIIDVSVSAVLPEFYDYIHSVGNYFKA